MPEYVLLTGWSIIVNMAPGGDHLALCGSAWGHPRIRNGMWTIPGNFETFDPETMTGVSASGTLWKLEDFRPTGNAPSLEAGIAFIQKNWIVRTDNKAIG